MKRPLDEIEFLARSTNRVEVLQLLAAEPHTRGELATATGASQATLGRILEDFVERSWVTRSDHTYSATATGRLVAEGVDELVSVLETEGKLRDVITYLPTAELGFDLRQLADATVTTPSRTRPSAPLQRVLEGMRGARTLRAFSHTLNEQSLTIAHERVTAGAQEFEAVLSTGAIDALASDDRLWTRLRALVDHDGAEIRVSHEEIPISVTVADDTVYVLVRDDGGILRAAIHTDDPEVREWASEAFSTHWERSRPFDPAAYDR
ncbi:putative transcriptional regulator [Halorubrum alkaliphilum]|uniref:Putative transcriptional regulator n=1 Tax=Halorubrum alkaliphilum TaxID=261290 RepID=A0A8T4GD13_9EURY|nr:transcriptional regulator FilR1 domain-containing protein [Halorubrum alkaliphilum]MBP1921371.1 putative transcriptional regulator [Halorubrum alkaliphilum]